MDARFQEAAGSRGNAKSAGLVCLIALACALTLAYEFSPGFMSFDTLYQYRQAKGIAALNDAHPVIMVMLWRFFASVSDNTGAMLLFHQILYWFTVGLFALLAARRLAFRLTLLLVIGFCPPLVITSLHIWKDVGMMCMLALACAALLGFLRHRHWGWLLLAALALFYAIAVRINGFIPGLFLLGFLAYAAVARARLTALKKTGVALLAVAALNLVYFQGIAALNASAEKSNGLGTLLVWDLAEISLARGEDVIPPYIPRVSGGPLLQDLARVRVPDTNYPYWAVVWPFPPQKFQSRLLPDWLKVVAANPGIYLKHRGHLFLTMLGIGVPKIYYPYHPGIDDNEFGFRFSHIGEQRVKSYFRAFDRLATTVFYKPWLYLLLCTATLALALQRLHGAGGNRDENLLAATVALSGIANMVSLFFLATAADYRYVIWTVFAGLLGGVMVAADVLRERRARMVGAGAMPHRERGIA